jgi:hypothetical protein
MYPIIRAKRREPLLDYAGFGEKRFITTATMMAAQDSLQQKERALVF